ncbi:YecA family protein [Acerihabitans sp. TG2]|uniref:YecA/YgfB family protein n=1 Tax=Acerihabitans sp. TG2 TaxID=3096008 RepID=UPI002B226F15|nr:YecA family protein [Acerihabitans sp. TG2]MEA9390423.1 YecA family protein [Acerihabitans sp. TG2]
MSEPINEPGLDFVGEMLLRYGNDDSILDLSELDGFLTAIISGPQTIAPSQWIPALWGGQEHQPGWESQAQLQRFFDPIFKHMNGIVSSLMDEPDQFTAMFAIRNIDEKEIIVAEEWCFGYMRGVELGDWTGLPPAMQIHLDAIALHGCEKNFPLLDKLTLEQHQQSVGFIEPAARALHRYYLDQRRDALTPRATPVKQMPKVGRNDPCPCGSGKKFKHCCLH